MPRTRHSLSVNERTPLVEPRGRMRSYTTDELISQHNRLVQRNRQNSIASVATWQSDLSVIDSIRDFVKERWPSLTTRRLVAAMLWGVIAVFIFSMVFLPRTSLSRDYRRIHFSKLTTVDTERLFLMDLSSSDMKRHIETLSNVSHLPGDGDGATQYVLDELKSYGLQPQRDLYYSWMLDYQRSGITLLKDGGVAHTVKMTETDPATGNEIPAYHEYSASGNVTAPFVFVNYASMEDYELLKFQGVDLNNIIHIARMRGGVSAALKVKHAELNGALAVITFSDPYDDGEITEMNGFDAYPDGPARSPLSIERSTLLLTTLQPGDPTSPGYPSLRSSKRHSPDPYIPKIPAIPVSAHEIVPILSQLDTLGSQMGWQGNLPFDYRPGPSSELLSIYNEQIPKTKLIKNIIHTIPGLLSDTIIIGAHRDTLTSVNGASTAHSGTAVLLEISRALSSLVNRGWKPLRTIVVASWDGGEAGGIGATEYGESANDLQRNGVMSIDLEGVSGRDLKAISHPLLSDVISTTAEKLKQDINILESPPVEGSVFQNHLGIPSCSIGFDSNDTAPLHKNSAFDTTHWLETYIDQNYTNHENLAKYAGLLAIQMSEHDVLSYGVENYIKHIGDSFEKIIDSIPRKWLLRVVYWRRRDISLPLALQDLFVSIEQLTKEAKAFDTALVSLQENIFSDYPWFKFYIKLRMAFQMKIMGTKARDTEKTFNAKGLNGREWYKSIIYGPDGDDGGKTLMLPGLVEAVEEGNVREFERWIRILDEKIATLKKLLRI